MKVNVLKCVIKVLVVMQSLVCYGQNYDPNAKVPRAVLGGLIFGELFGARYDVYDHPAVSFPNPYIDLQIAQTEGADSLWNKLKVVSRLDFADGVAPFFSETKGIVFKPFENSRRASAIMNLLESCNISPASSGSIPFNDVVIGDYYTPYIVKACQLGIILSSDGSSFRPYDELINGDLFRWVSRMKTQGLFSISRSQLENLNNYFIPNNYIPSQSKIPTGLEQGVFNHYSTSSFFIPDIEQSLSFSHSYSSMMAELPSEIYPILPMGKGWSHTYNAYAVRNDVEGDDVFSIVWPDGTIHHYNDDEDKYETDGVFDEVSFRNSKRTLLIKHKDQSVHEFLKNAGEQIWYLVKIISSNGNTITINYEDAENGEHLRIVSVEAPSGRKLWFSYIDNTDLLEEVEDPARRRIYFEYEGLSSNWFYINPVLVSFEDAEHNITRYSYLSFRYSGHLLTRIQLPRGNVIKATYNDDKKLSQYQMNNEPEITITFDYYFNDLQNTFKSTVKKQLPNGTIESLNYTFDVNENLRKYSSNASKVDIEYFDGTSKRKNLPVKIIADGLETRYEYSTKGNMTSSSVVGSSGILKKSYSYDEFNNVTRFSDEEGNVTRFEYDSGQNLVSIIDALGNRTIFVYLNGLLSSITNPEGIVIRFNYDSFGAITQIVAPEGVSITQTFDNISRLLSVRANGITSFFEYDKNDNVTKITDGLGRITQFQFDENDNLKKIINAKGVLHSFNYDNKDRVVQSVFNNLSTSFAYNNNSSLDKITKPSGATVEYDYDTKGRMNQMADISDIDYTSNNDLESITNPNGKIEFQYDDYKRVKEIKTVHNAIVKYNYRKTGQTNKLEYPLLLANSARTDYYFDPKNRVSSINFVINKKVYSIANFTYRKDNKISTVQWGNGVLRSNTFDGLGRVKSFEIKKPNAAIIYHSVIDYDVHSNIPKETTLRASFPIVVPSSDPIPSTIPFSFDSSNFITSGAGKAYQVSADGNTISLNNGDQTATFTLEDRLASFTNFGITTIFKYDAFGQRVEVVRNGVITKYIRDVLTDNVLVELDVNNNPLYYYIYNLDGTLLARYNHTTQRISYYHGDIRGSVIALTDESGNITHHYAYEDFGALDYIYEPANESNRYRYVGTLGVEYENDDLYYMRARYYQPSTGRFLSQDPVWSTNLFVYADNNPITNVDPYGEQALAVGLGVLISSEAVATIASITAITATSAYYLDKILKEVKEINNKKSRKKRGEVYALIVNDSGDYRDVRGNMQKLKVGDIWKYGETSTPTKRYTELQLKTMIPGGVTKVHISEGSEIHIKTLEKILIYAYRFENGERPPGNSIDR